MRPTFTILILPVLLSCGPVSERGASTTVPGPMAAMERQAARKLPKAPASTSRLEDLITFATIRSPLLRAQYHRYRAARARAGVVGRLPNPEISWTWFIRPIETRDGPQRHRITLSQRIPWLSKLRADREVARRIVDREATALTSLQSLLFYDLKRSWFTLWRLRERLALLEDTGRTLTIMEKVTRTRYRVRSGSTAGIMQLALARGLIVTKTARVREALAVETARLNRILGVRGLSFRPPRELPGSRIPPEADLRRKMLHDNPLLADQDRAIDVQRAALERSRTAGFPDFMVGLGYMETGSTDLMGAVHPGRDPVSVTVGISIPLYRGAEAARRREQRARLDYLDTRREALQIALDARLVQSLARLRASAREIADYDRRLLPLTQTGLAATEAEYASGRGELTATLEVVRTALSLRMGRVDAVFRHTLAVAELERLTGSGLFMKGKEVRP